MNGINLMVFHVGKNIPISRSLGSMKNAAFRKLLASAFPELTWPMAKLEKAFSDYIFSRENKVQTFFQGALAE